MPSDPESDASDLESFHRWLSSTAAAEGISEAQLVNELLSYYWIVNELSRSVEDAPDAHGFPPGSDELSLESLHGETGPEGPFSPQSGSGEPELADRSAGEEPSPGASPDDEPAGASDGGDGGDDLTGTTASTPAGVAEAVADLQDDIEALRDRQETALQSIRETVADVERRQDRLASRSADEDTFEEVATIQAAVVDELTAIGDDIAAATDRQESLETSQERLEERIEAEFDDLEAILTHLLETVRELDSAVDDATDRHTGDIKMLKYQLQKHHHLEELKRGANLAGIERADCENCGQTVHLGLLESPFCPDCGEQFARVEPTWLPFRNARIENGGPLKR
jgi:predicted  nucleic acid-binding Zn-ribbon protein